MALGGSRGAMLGLALILAGGCEARDEDRSLDGGAPLRDAYDAEAAGSMASQPCWRRERGRWHHSVGHCETMAPRATIEGLWVTAFEENSFFPGETHLPDPRDPRRYSSEIELDDDAVFRAIGRKPGDPSGEAVYLRFSGRRTRDPLMVDCYGGAYFVYVVDRLIEARYVGAMRPFPPGYWQWLARNQPPASVKRVHQGRWGKLEAEAVERCSGRRPSADRLEDAVDQTPSQARPPGKVSAE
jgi:hypothetical protein